MIRKTLICLVPALAACGSDSQNVDTGLDGLAITTVQPSILLPGTKLVVQGSSFVTEDLGTAAIVFDGGASVPLAFADFDRYEAVLDENLFAGLPQGTLSGNAVLEVLSNADGNTYKSAPFTVSMEVRDQLDVSLSDLTVGAVSYVNDEIQITGSGFLLGGDEGQTYALVQGCFQPQGSGTCDPISPTEVAVTPVSEFDRGAGSFPFAPSIAGIREGNFEGTVSLRNGHSTGGSTMSSSSSDLVTELTTAAIFSMAPQASLGQYVDIEGGGFVGGADDGTTEIEFDGTFTPDRSGDPVDMAFSIIPAFDKGRRVRYVLNEDDMLGQTIDLRRITGTFQGTIKPIVHFGSDTQEGFGFDFSFRIAPVKQVVYLKFFSSYKDTLRIFGLRAMEDEIRKRVLAVTSRDYATINVEFRTEEPTDFALYSTVDIAGINPNWRSASTSATLGLDNTPDKDVGNERLHDHLGIQTFTDENTFGGVFVQALLGFSEHPGELAKSVPEVASPLFDETFDPFRPDQGGKPVSSADFAAGNFQPLTSGESCPASDRAGQVQCAVWTLGNLIGTTLTHEVGHSLGLANPYGSGFHLSSDEINRIMDNGGDRPFNERAQLMGEGPGTFCQSHYEYLRDILPSDEPEDTTPRPTCF